MNTEQEYREVITACRNIYTLKMKDYGPSWRIMRPQTVNDQLFIKAKRIRTIEMTGVNLVGDDIRGELMLRKNHDYGEAWRDMLPSSLTDIILTKINRNKQINANDGRTLISEGADGNYFDMLNYAVFYLIKYMEADT